MVARIAECAVILLQTSALQCLLTPRQAARGDHALRLQKTSGAELQQDLDTLQHIRIETAPDSTPRYEVLASQREKHASFL